jgi:ABC-type transport system substrate-binding protein
MVLSACQPSEIPTPEEVEEVEEVEETEEPEIEEPTVEQPEEPTEPVSEMPDDAAEEQTLRILAMGRTGPILDPAIRGWYNELTLLWMPLVGGDENFNPNSSGLAESWDISEDGIVYTFHLNPDAKFSDGSPITAEDAAWSLGYLIMMGHPDTYGQNGNYAWTRFYGDRILGANAYFNGEEPFERFAAAEVEGINVIDDHTLEITLTQPYPAFLGMLVELSNIMHPESVMAGQDEEYAEEDWWTTEENAVFSGPFMLESLDPGERMVMVPNPHFHGPEPYLDRIEVIWGGDENTALALFQNGEVDVITRMLGADALREAFADTYLRESMHGFGDNTLIAQFWITPYPPMDDVHVRRAVSMAIDREALINVLNAGEEIWQGTTGHFIPTLPPCIDAKQATEPLPFDPEAAREELMLSSYGEDVLDMELNIAQSIGGEPVLNQTVQRMLQENLGLTNVQIRTETVTDWVNPPFATHMWFNNQGEGHPDPRFTVGNMIVTIPTEPPEPPMPVVTGSYIPELTTLYDELLAAETMDEACSVMEDIYDTWNQEVMSLDFGQVPFAYLVQPWVGNWVSRGGNKHQMYLFPGVEQIYIAEH